MLSQVEGYLAGVERAMARLDEGTYDVCEQLQDGWTNTAPLCVEVTVGGGKNAEDVNFLNFQDVTIYNVKVVENEDNRGFGPASNEGSELARAPLLLFLNTDALVQPGWFEPLSE